MKTSIFKYKLNSDQSQHFEMPIGAGILSVKVINNVAFLYALVNTEDTETEMKTVEIVFTGDELKEGPQYRFIDTYTITKVDAANDSKLSTYVGHVFELLTDEKSDTDLRDTDADKNEAFEEFAGTNQYYNAFFGLVRSGFNPDDANKVLRATFDAGYDA